MEIFSPLISVILISAFSTTTGMAFFESAFWKVPQNDLSQQYLGAIFGPMGTVLTGAGSVLLGQLFSIFNIAVLALGSLVVSYTIILTTINTAQEGEVMGKKWSSVWIPLRSTIGMGFLLPTGSGYSLVQMLMMQIVLYGVAAADQLWATVSQAINQGTASGSVTMTPTPTKAAVSLLSGLVCVETINSAPSCVTAVNGGVAAAYTVGNTVFFGIEGNATYTNVCGSISAASGVPNNVDPTEWGNANVSAFYSAISGGLSNAANEIVNVDAANWTSGQNLYGDAVKAIQGTVAVAATLPTQPQQITDYGWLFAGSYYFQLVSANNATTYPAPTTAGLNTTQLSALGSACSATVGKAQQVITDYVKAQNVSNPSSTGVAGLNYQAASVDSNAQQMYDSISTPIETLTLLVLGTLTTRAGDPVTSLRQIGSNIMITCENLWFTIMLAGLIIMLAGCSMAGIQPLCYALGVIITILTPVLSLMIVLLWAAGGAVGLYLPLVPYLVFSFTALGWFVLVIETIAAAPIVALGLVSPSAENLGKASPAVMIIANVFLRPSLMVIGFVTSAKLVSAAIAMVNFGFSGAVTASTNGIGLFGCIALIFIYCGLVVAIIHECFSLIHVLPDKIMRWIGGSAERSGDSVKSQVGEIKKASEEGHKTGGEMMKGSAAAFGGMAAKEGMGGDKKK